MKIDSSKLLAFLLQDFKLISNQPKLINKTKNAKSVFIQQYSQPHQGAEVSHVLQSRTEFTANFASNFYDTRIAIWSTMAVHFCLNPTLCYVHIINPAVHGSCTDALFCHACL